MNETGTIRISKTVIRDLKKFLAPTDGKIKDFVEGAIVAQIEANRICRKIIGLKSPKK